jgi:hypothetical protein
MGTLPTIDLTDDEMAAARKALADDPFAQARRLEHLGLQ